MTERNEHVLDETQLRAERAVCALERPIPDEAFRRDLKASFMSGAISEADAETRIEDTWVPGRDTTFWPLLRFAAAAALVVMLAQWANSGPDLHIAGSTAGSLVVDGKTYSTEDLGVIPLDEGSSLTLGTSGPLELLIDGVALFEVAPGTRMTVPGSPGKWFGRRTEMRVEQGELRFLSGTDFAGATLHVFTPEGMVEVVGTLLSVQRDDTGTCVCVLEGHARVGVDTDHLEAVTAGSRKVMPIDGDPYITTVKPMHRDGVVHFESSQGHLVRPR